MDKPIHPRELSLEDGVFLVKLARRTVETKLVEGKTLEPPDDTPEHLRRPGMVFTTIETYHGPDKRSLRGCIGFLQPVYPLVEAVIRSALEAAFNDPRFYPLEKHELDHVTFEVAILSVPEPLEISDRWELPKKIIIGRHGLVARRGLFQGTLLPQVPVEYCWDPETFLAETCMKAGMEPDCWLDSSVEILFYEGRVFQEREPLGEVVERDLNKEYMQQCKIEGIRS